MAASPELPPAAQPPRTTGRATPASIGAPGRGEGAVGRRRARAELDDPPRELPRARSRAAGATSVA